MQRVQALALLLTLSACQQDFDAQYEATEKRLRDDAKRIEAEMQAEAAKDAGQK